MTDGAVVMRSRLNSRSSRSVMISRCRRPRKPQRKPKPSAAELSVFEREAGVVEAQTRHGIAQILEVRRIDREQTAEHHRLRRLEARQRLRRRVLLVGHGIADARVGHFLDRRREEAHLAGPQLRQHFLLRAEDADALHLIVAAGGHHLHLLAALEHALFDAHQHHDAEIGVVPAIDEHGLERLVGVARQARGSRSTIASSTAFTLRPVLAETPTASDASMPITSSICFLTRSSSADGRSILFRTGQDFEVVVERLIDVGERLRFHALARIDDQDGAFAGGKRLRDTS